MHYDDVKDKTTNEVKELLASLKEPFGDVRPLISICMALCDRIVSLEDRFQDFKKQETQDVKIKNLLPNTGKKAIDRQEQLREAARVAEEQDTSGQFNAMAWLDLELEDNPGTFDRLFDRAWDGLSEKEQEKRTRTIRSFL